MALAYGNDRMTLFASDNPLAAERVHFVVIQQEAMQLSGCEEFFQNYEVPDEVSARLSPRRCK